MEAGLRREGRVRQDRQGPVLVLWLDHPPVNALSSALRQALAAGLAGAAADAQVGAVVIAAEGAQFSAGADLTELGQGIGAAPDLGALCLQIETFGKPVVAAVQASALGGGCELALAAHFRVALATARLGLPEVKLGLLPGAGGTQRLPRLIGAAQALRLMQGGEAVTAAEALALGMVDLVVEDQVVAAAVQAALGLIGSDWARLRAARRTSGMRDPMAYQAAVQAARRQAELGWAELGWAELGQAELGRVELGRVELGRAGPLPAAGWGPAAGRIADCVEAALVLPFAQGLAFERAAFEDLLASPEAQGLRHAFFTERRAVYPPKAVASVAPPRLGSVAIWGAGGGAADLARQALCAGLRVTVVELDRAVLVTALERIAGWQEAGVAAGRLSAEARDADWARLVPVLVAEGLVGADLVLAMAGAGPVPGIAASVPQIVVGGGGPVGLRPGPVGLQPGAGPGDLAELSAYADAPVALQALGLAFARRMGWRVVFATGAGGIESRLRAIEAAAVAALETNGVAGDVIRAALASFGFGAAPVLPPVPPGGGEVLSFVLAALANEGGRMLSEGVALRPADVDAVAVMSGFYPRFQGGPMLWADRRGALVLRGELQRRAVAHPALFTPAPVFDQIIAEGTSFAARNRG